MPTVANTLFDRGAIGIREEIGSSSLEILRSLDPTFATMFLPNMQTNPSGFELGRDLRFKKRFYGSMAGVIRGGNQTAYSGQFGNVTNSFAGRLQTNNRFSYAPRAQDGAMPIEYGITGRLYDWHTNLLMPLALMQMEALPANITDRVAPILRGFAKQMSLYAATSFFANPSQQFRLCTLPAQAGITIDAPNRTVTFVTTERTIHKMNVGQPIDVWNAAGSARLNQADGNNEYGSEAKRVVGFVLSIDPFTNTVILGFDSAAADTSAATFGTWCTAQNLASGFVTYSNTYNGLNPNGASLAAGFDGMYSWRDFAKWGNASASNADKRILGSRAVTDGAEDFIDVSQRPEFRSFRASNVGALTETRLMRDLNTVHRALDTLGYHLDTLLAAEGVWLGVFDQRQNLERITYGRAGQVSSLNSLGLAQGFSITYDGRTYEGYTSRFLEAQTLVGFRRMGNWAIVTPPQTPMTTRGGIPEVPDQIPLDFYMPALTGTPSIRFPVLGDDGRIADACQIPAKATMQFFPVRQFNMAVWEGVNDVFGLSE